MSEQGRRTPLDERPVYPRDYAWYREVFTQLSSSRNIGQGVGYIPYSEYVAYFTINEPLDDVRDDIRILQVFDSIFIKHYNDKMKLEEGRHTKVRPNANRKN